MSEAYCVGLNMRSQKFVSILIFVWVEKEVAPGHLGGKKLFVTAVAVFLNIMCCTSAKLGPWTGKWNYAMKEAKANLVSSFFPLLPVGWC